MARRTLEAVNAALEKCAREPFGPGSRSFPGYGGHRVIRWGKRFVVGTWNHGHGNWTVESRGGGHGYGPTIADAAGACTPVTMTLGEVAQWFGLA